jgi:5-methylcytosine-specific restriction endonuclease McrA
MKYLPIDRDTSNMLAPILDFSSKAMFDENEEVQPNYPVITMQQPVKTTKRSVSETKKKFVASRQNWKCDNCKEQLKASFEVDHIIRLEHGGSNHIDNLVALCRGCHGDKTTIENL